MMPSRFAKTVWVPEGGPCTSFGSGRAYRVDVKMETKGTGGLDGLRTVVSRLTAKRAHLGRRRVSSPMQATRIEFVEAAVQLSVGRFGS